MWRSLISTALATLLLGGSRLQEDPSAPRLLREIEAHGPITDSRGADIIVTSDRIQFRGPKGKLIKELLLPGAERSRVTLSKTGHANLLQTIVNGIFLSEADGPRIVERVFRKGARFGRVARAQQRRSAPLGDRRHVNGACHEGGCTAAIRLIDRTRPEGLRITPTVDPSAESNGGDIAADGKTFAITFRTDPDRASLVYFDIDGHQLWAYHKDDAQGNEVGVSPAGNFVAATIREVTPRQNRIYLFSRDGRVIAQEDTEYVGDYRFAFSDDETTLAVAASTGSLVVFDTGTRKVRWKYSTVAANTGFIDLDVWNGFVIASVTTRNPSDPFDGSLPRFVYLFAGVTDPEHRGRPAAVQATGRDSLRIPRQVPADPALAATQWKSALPSISLERSELDSPILRSGCSS